MWRTRVITDGTRNCAFSAVCVAPKLEVDCCTAPEKVLGLDDLKPPVSLLKLEHLVFGISEGFEAAVYWDGVLLIPLSGRGRFDFAEIRGIAAGKELSLAVSRPKLETSPFRTVFLLFELIKQMENE